MQKGLTLIELMITIVLILSFSGLVFPFNYHFFQASTIGDQARDIEGFLREVQMAAISGQGDSDAGIKFSQTGYTLFEGESYSDRRRALDRVIPFPFAVSVDGQSEIIFQKTTGLPIFPGLAGHWQFDEKAGSIAYDSSCYLNQNRGAILGSNWSRTEGKEGRALEFNGSEAVAIENHGGLNPAEKITLSAWLNIPSIQDSGVIKKGNAGTGKGYNLFLSGAGYITFELRGQNEARISNIFDPKLLDQWVHLTATWDGQTMRQYVNGELQPNAGVFSGVIEPAEDDLIIGDGLRGKIDDVRLYNYALSKEDVKTNYLARKDEIAIGLTFGENRRYITINSQGKIEAIK